MSIGGSALHHHRSRIKWTKAHGTREAVNRCFRLAEPGFCPTAKSPCLSQIGIQRKRSINQGRARFKLVSYIHECISAHSESGRVIFAELNRPLSELCYFGNLIRCDQSPAIGFGRDVASGRPSVGRRKIRIEFDRAAEQAQCVVVCLSACELKLSRRTAKIERIGIQALGWLALGALVLRDFHRRRDSSNDTLG